jgi:hypothetical protein
MSTVCDLTQVSQECSMRKTLMTVIGVAAVCSLTACEASKSSNPLSPSVAGPIPGVNITAPQAISPSQGARIANGQQPVTLTIRNAQSNGKRPLSYVFEVATDTAFAQKVYSRSGVTPGDGQTSHRVSDALSADHTYYWRARAVDGANSGDFMQPASFAIFTPVVFGAPGLAQPANGARVSSLRPLFVLTNASRTGPAGVIVYVIDLALDQAFTQRIAIVTGGEQTGQTQLSPGQDLPASKQIFWRARATDSANEGPWSPAQMFTTPGGGSPSPGPSPGPTPGPAPSANDAIDVRGVSIVKGADIRGWAVTSTLTRVTVGNGQLCTEHTKAGRWPQLPFFSDPATVEGNQWVFANIGGRWYGGAAEWLRPGQTCKHIDSNFARDSFAGTVMASWYPRSGESVGFAVSTPARAGQWGPPERSNIVVIPWP